MLNKKKGWCYSLRSSLRTVLFPAPMPPPMNRRRGLRSLCAIGTITSVHCESSGETRPIAFISSTNVVNTLATFRFFVTLSNLCSLSHFKQFYNDSWIQFPNIKHKRSYLVACMTMFLSFFFGSCVSGPNT